jgi:hypothetical protein
MKLWELDELIRTVCPVDGINSDGVIFFKETATEEERITAEALMQQYFSEIEA